MWLFSFLMIMLNNASFYMWIICYCCRQSRWDRTIRPPFQMVSVNMEMLQVRYLMQTHHQEESEMSLCIDEFTCQHEVTECTGKTNKNKIPVWKLSWKLWIKMRFLEIFSFVSYSLCSDWSKYSCFCSVWKWRSSVVGSIKDWRPCRYCIRPTEKYDCVRVGVE